MAFARVRVTATRADFRTWFGRTRADHVKYIVLFIDSKLLWASIQTVSFAVVLLMLSMQYAITPIRRTKVTLCLCSCSSQAKDCPRHSRHNQSPRFHRITSNPFH